MEAQPNECLTTLTPDKLPDPWLFDSEYLLSRLKAVRELALRVPVTLETYEPTKTVVDTIWRLEEDMRFMLTLQIQRQRDFAKKGQEMRADAAEVRQAIAH